MKSRTDNDLSAPLMAGFTNSNNLELVEFPGYTSYHETKCCCCKKYTIHPSCEVFFGHWKFSWFAPLSVLTLILSSYIYNLIVILYNLPDVPKFICGIILSLIMILYIWSYFSIIIIGPGYFPFYYSGIASKKLTTPFPPGVSGVNDSPAGYISNSEQHLYATTNIKPNRSILAKSARRIIIRPDHMCVWAASWIGKLNMKSFILFTMYGFIYCLVLVGITIAGAIIQRKSIVKLVFNILWILVGCGFGYWQFSLSLQSIINMRKGRTTWEIWNKIDPLKFDRSVKENVADVFGKNPGLFGYIFPTNPFKGLSNLELVEKYANYYTA